LRDFCRRIARAVSVLACCSAPNAALAFDLAVTAFGTIGYAITDQRDLRYLRFIDNDGTFKTDSLAGVQLESRFGTGWGATVQAAASAARMSDEGYEAKIRWAFLSYRPTSDWLFRLGRLRPPILIHLQNAEVGVTYDYARLPAEVYSLSPVYDIDGGAITKTWLLHNRELSLDAYWGKTDVRFRLPFRGLPTPGQSFAGPFTAPPADRYIAEDLVFKGLTVSHNAEGLFLRGGVHHADIDAASPVPETFVPVPIAAPPGLGGVLYQPVNFKQRFDILVLTFGAEWRSGPWRVTGEYGQRILNDTKVGIGSRGAYVTVARAVGPWTPYITYARLLSSSETRRIFEEVSSTPVPPAVQGPPFFVAPNTHQVAAGLISVFDQYSTMVGASYSFSPTSKLKLEWMRTHVGLGSSLVDGDVRNRSFNVFSLSYSMAF
jgi:hypothetical protein